MELSKDIIESIIIKSTLFFAYPFRSVPAAYKEILTDYGYAYTCSVGPIWENNLALRRMIYHNGDTDKILQQKLSPFYKYYRMIIDPLTA